MRLSVAFAVPQGDVAIEVVGLIYRKGKAMTGKWRTKWACLAVIPLLLVAGLYAWRTAPLDPEQVGVSASSETLNAIRAGDLHYGNCVNGDACIPPPITCPGDCPPNTYCIPSGSKGPLNKNCNPTSTPPYCFLNGGNFCFQSFTQCEPVFGGCACSKTVTFGTWYGVRTTC